MLSIGYDIGSSSIKASILNIETGEIVGKSFYPENEMEINSPQAGFAEQDPEMWWKYLKILTEKIFTQTKLNKKDVRCIGITYQMHGLVLVDKNKNVIRPSIIWCDSRAVRIGNTAFEEIGKDYCLEHFLNSPGNFTASKLKWVKENEPENYKKIFKFMLPGDFISMKLTGEVFTTASGLSECILWDYKNNSLSKDLLKYYEIDDTLVPDIKPTFSDQGCLSKQASNELGFNEETIVSYRAGDQPNNAFSLNVLNPGEIAATAGTSGVVYGIIDKANYDKYSRVNPFIHVNNSDEKNRLGVLLCINGTGILNSWTRKNFAENLSYEEINKMALEIPIGSEGINVLPFGNGSERILENKNIGCKILGIDFNRHSKSHIFRAAQEGIAFSFQYGIEIMKEMGFDLSVIRAGKANMFLSNIFTQTLSNISGAIIELYDTDGAIGAARGAAIGAGFYNNFEETFKTQKKLVEIIPNKNELEECKNAYNLWQSNLKLFL